MSWRDLFSSKLKCPNCGREGAQKAGSGYKCPNPHCKWYDAALDPGSSGNQVMTPSGAVPGPAPSGSVQIRYRNFKGESKTFNVDPSSAVRKKNHWVIKASPGDPRTLSLRNPQTGEPMGAKSIRSSAITLSRDRIENLDEFEAAMPQRVAPGQEWPSARERQVLNYHKKYKTSSPLYEQIRAKYPNW